MSANETTPRRHSPEGRSPAKGLADRGADRNAEDVGDGQPDKDERDGEAAALLLDHGRRTTIAVPK